MPLRTFASVNWKADSRARMTVGVATSWPSREPKLFRSSRAMNTGAPSGPALTTLGELKMPSATLNHRVTGVTDPRR
jgi:hypothetical protein